MRRHRVFRLVGLVVLVGSPGCVRPPPPPPPQATAPPFRPEVWFGGRMHSHGALAVILRPLRGLTVDSVGKLEPDGTLRLDQAIHWRGGAVDHRFWLMKPAGEGRYDVTMSDARGPVFFEVNGARAYLRYRDRHAAFALTIEQWMDLQPNGRNLRNVGFVRVLGLPIARLDEVIEHEP